MRIIFLCIFIHLTQGNCFLNVQEELNLEDHKSDFILSTFQIKIPNYPNAFNPSIIRWRGCLLMSFRVILDRKQSFNSELGLVCLDEQFQILGEPQLLNTQTKTPWIPSRSEDGRLIQIGDRLYLIYSNCTELKISKKGFRVHIGEISYDGEKFHLEDPEPLLYFTGEDENKREKNWVPFNYEETLFLAYSLSPHLIFYPLRGLNTCETVAFSSSMIQWPFGTLRGSTPALLEGDEYLSFFHSSKKISSIHSDGKDSLHYFIGAYRFKKEPPFEITEMSSEPIIGEGFYSGATYQPYWHPVQAVFPCGFIQDENFIWIAYGRQDHECWIALLDKKGLMKSLIPTPPLIAIME